MKILKNILRPIAYLAGSIISRNSKIFEIYRQNNFRGKLFLSEYINHKSQNGIYICGQLHRKYNIDFDDQIQEAVYLGTYERHEINFLKEYIKPGWICLDIGANIGFYTLNLSKLVGSDGKVYAIEPSPINYKKLEENIKINNSDNCITSNVALSSESGEFLFSVSPHQNSGWGRLGKWKSAQSEVIVNVNTLDDFVISKNISNIDFLKIDIEGHELKFLEGGQNTFKNGIVKRIMIEYCGYVLEPQGVTLKSYVNSIMELDYTPVYFNLDKIEKARNETYQNNKEILNLLFEKIV